MSKVLSIQVLTERSLTLHNEHWIPHSVWMVYVDIYKTWMEGTYDISLKKSLDYFFVTTESNRMGFSPKCR